MMMTSLSSPPTLFKPISCFTSQSISTTSNRRPAVILPGLGNNSGDYSNLQLTLKEKYGVPSVVAKVSRIDWLRNATGLVDPNYWQGTLSPRPVLDWYLKKIDEAVLEAQELAQGGKLSVIGHSAGGWLARLYIEEFGLSNISLLLTLGTPHLPPPKGSPGVIDQTRGLLYYVQKYCREAVYTRELKYVCIAGRYIKGARIFTDSSVNADSAAQFDVNEQPTSEVVIISNTNVSTSTSIFRARFVGQGYKQVCGQADVWGDGVVPEVSAHLEGALNLSLERVYHSPVGSDDLLRPWYGSSAVIDQWIQHLLD